MSRPSDARILPGGTAAMTDVGMTGPHDSVIGVEADLAIRRMRTGMPVRFETAQGGVRLEGALVDCDAATGRATAIAAGADRALTAATSSDEQHDEAEVADEHEPRREPVEVEDQLPVAARETSHASARRRRRAARAPATPPARRPDRPPAGARPGTAATAPCRARRTRREQPRRPPRDPRRRRPAAREAPPDVPENAELRDRRHRRRDDRNRPGQVLRAVRARPAERHSRRVVEGDQDAGAEALDLERPVELAANAPRHTIRATARRTAGRRARRRRARSPSATSASRLPRRRQVHVTASGRTHHRIQLHRDRSAEDTGPEPVAARPGAGRRRPPSRAAG